MEKAQKVHCEVAGRSGIQKKTVNKKKREQKLSRKNI